MEPSPTATTAEWKEWGEKLKHRISQLDSNSKKYASELKKARDEISEKDRACSFYKSEIVRLKSTIENIKYSKHYILSKRIYRIYSRVRQFFSTHCNRR
jgi:chromosome segregation ATPase